MVGRLISYKFINKGVSKLILLLEKLVNCLDKPSIKVTAETKLSRRCFSFFLRPANGVHVVF
jgi:hypothetical protein